MQDLVVAWFTENKRDLPWRRPSVSPWGVLVSEFMLQQTPAARVIEPFERWMRLWPQPGALASATPGDAVREWRNLGYPRRALWLHQSACVITHEFDGEVPADVESLQRLPGVGPYTARAVAAFAFGEHEAVVDTNIRRVIARWLHGESDQGPASAARDVADMASLLPDPDISPTFNAAVMELGAVVCTARRPACEDCPLLASCAWASAGWPDTGARGAAPQKAYRGSDREARGALLRALRESPTPLTSRRLAAVWPDEVQRQRALRSLVTDGLVVSTERRRYALP